MCNNDALAATIGSDAAEVTARTALRIPVVCISDASAMLRATGTPARSVGTIQHTVSREDSR